ncbi:MAG: methyltransferase domain-containing protein, partial [Cyanothece sp. SIO1E1]|nr:methyltransferase domain-containing protein [Cyanothece sp. SIO1E1]
PVPADEARDWVEHAANRVLALKPDRVLDVGCGLGRTLFRVAPSCGRYWGLDFSQPALNYVEAHLHLLPNKETDIRFFHAAANELNTVPDAAFDLVILNGVVQYFPSTSYLLDAIEQSMQLIPGSGHVFIGDVRSKPLLHAFHLSVELFKAETNDSLTQVLERVDQKVRNEEELLVDPDFFHALTQTHPRISEVEIQLKRGWPLNELTRFRYDVTLKIEGASPDTIPQQNLDWAKDHMTPDRLRSSLQGPSKGGLLLKNVPNARINPEVALSQRIDALPTESSVKEVRDQLESDRKLAYHPELFWQLASDVNCEARISWANESDHGYFDVRFTEIGAEQHPGAKTQPPEEVQTELAARKQLSGYGNIPLLAKASSTLGSALLKLAEEELPHYMVPSTIMVIDQFPLTPNGKIDRKRLPVPSRARPAQTTKKTSTPLETLIANTWSEVLEIEDISTDENFFDLGGHSISAARIMNRLNRQLSDRIPMVILFDRPTVEELAEYLEAKGVKPVTS